MRVMGVCSYATRWAQAMPEQADPAGVAHSIADHAASGVSYVSPDLAQALRAAGAHTTEINLLSEQPYPPNAGESQSLRLALAARRGFVVSLLEKHGFSLADVSSVVLRATPVRLRPKRLFASHTGCSNLGPGTRV